MAGKPSRRPQAWLTEMHGLPATAPNRYTGDSSRLATPTTCPLSGSCTSSLTARSGVPHSAAPEPEPVARPARIFRQPGGLPDEGLTSMQVTGRGPSAAGPASVPILARLLSQGQQRKPPVRPGCPSPAHHPAPAPWRIRAQARGRLSICATFAARVRLGRATAGVRLLPPGGLPPGVLRRLARSAQCPLVSLLDDLRQLRWHAEFAGELRDRRELLTAPVQPEGREVVPVEQRAEVVSDEGSGCRASRQRLAEHRRGRFRRGERAAEPRR